MSHSYTSTSATTSQINDEILDGRENATAVAQDQQVASQYYRPYYYNRRPAYNYNQRPNYPSNYRPTYGNNQRPTYNSVSNNYRPATTRRPNVSNNNLCSSSTPIDSNQGNWICWDQTNQRLRMGPNLTIEKFVIFYAQLAQGPVDQPGFRRQICEQSRRFNNVGIYCVPFRIISQGDGETGFESEGECRSKTDEQIAFSVCDNISSLCVCISDQYDRIAYQNKSPYVGYEFQQALAASGSYQSQHSVPFTGSFITANNLNQYFPSWMLPYING